MNRKKKFKKKCFTINLKYIYIKRERERENLHFIPNNILTKFFKELTKYKNDYE